MLLACCCVQGRLPAEVLTCVVPHLDLVSLACLCATSKQQQIDTTLAQLMQPRIGLRLGTHTDGAAICQQLVAAAKFEGLRVLRVRSIARQQVL